MSLSRACTFFLLVCSAGGCNHEGPEPARLLVSFITQSDPGEPLSGVSVSVQDLPVGKSDAGGLLQTVLTGRPGQKLTVRYDCPLGHRAEREAPGLQLPDRERPAGGVDSVEMVLRCPPVLRTVAIAVRAGAGVELPVLLDGEPLGQTDSAGVAHFYAEAKPGTQLTVRLDTSSRPELRPRSPFRHFVVPDRHEAFLMAQSFHRARQPKRRSAKPFRIIKIE